MVGQHFKQAYFYYKSAYMKTDAFEGAVLLSATMDTDLFKPIWIFGFPKLLLSFVTLSNTRLPTPTPFGCPWKIWGASSALIWLDFMLLKLAISSLADELLWVTAESDLLITSGRSRMHSFLGSDSEWYLLRFMLTGDGGDFLNGCTGCRQGELLVSGSEEVVLLHLSWDRKIHHK